MKAKFAIAGVLTMCGATAEAQSTSSVTIYGLIDQTVSRYTGASAINPTLSLALLGNANQYTVHSATSSRLGFRGSEDLGSGMKANFLIENRFAPDTGAIQAGQTGIWGGQSYVGLESSTYGEVRLGHQFVPGHPLATYGDPWGLDYNVAGGYGFVKGGSTVSYAGNAVDYRTPIFGGVQVEVQAAAAEGGTPAGSIQPGRNLGAAVIYRDGPVYVGAAYNYLRTGTALDNRFYLINGTYDFGVIKPYLSYAVARNNSNQDSKSYLIGFTAPVGVGRVKAMVGMLNPAGANNTTKKVGLAYEYFLSKRTNLHVDLAAAKTDRLSRAKGFEFGIKHLF